MTDPHVSNGVGDSGRATASSIRDKVAEELCEADETIGHKPWAECSEYERDTYRLSAGIAIAAYRAADREARTITTPF